MSASFYFYDLETSGINPRTSRIMQFAGQRTDMNLKPIGDPDNILVALTDDILPEPDAILITKITPQQTRMDGISEAEFLKYFSDQVAVPDTIFVGFNNIRFDDEFMRFTLYRNFHDAYEWAWRDGRCRWDMLDVIRMTRALRPDGINWPFDSDGKPTNRLELLTDVNKLEHTAAHDALSDVNATIAVSLMIRNKQPKLFDFLLGMRDKRKVQEFINSNKMFVYTSGRYASAYEKTTVVTALGGQPGKQGVLVYDLRTDPAPYLKMTPAELATAWRTRVEDETKRFPIKLLQLNRSPAIAPLGVLDDVSKERIKINLTQINQNFKSLDKKLYDNLLAALKLMDKQTQSALISNENDVDGQLYDGFVGDADKTKMSVVRAAGRDEISSLDIEFSDKRLATLLPLYKARNFKNLLTSEEREVWEAFRYNRLMAGGANSLASKFFTRLGQISERPNLSKDDQFLLQELQLYGESIMPELGE